MSKICTHCHAKKPLSDFTFDKRAKDGRVSACKICLAEVHRLFRKNNPVSANGSAKKWRLKHQDLRVVYSRRSYEKNRAKRIESATKYRIDNPQKCRARAAVKRAIKRGDLQRQPCEACGESRVHGHHDNYNRPLSVRWLCSQHHQVAHIQARQIGEEVE